MKTPIRALTLILAAAVISAAFSGCSFFGRGTVQGDKKVLPRTYQLESGGGYSLVVSGIIFDGLSGVDCIITIDDSQRDALVVTTDENIWQALDIEIGEDGVITVTGDGKTTYQPSEFEIVLGMTPVSIDIGGGYRINYLLHDGTAADITISGAADLDFIADRPLSTVLLTVSGACSAEMSGTADMLSADISGTASLKAYGLETRECAISASGAISAQVYATGKLTAKISGTGAVTYRGDPAEVVKDIEGVGSVEAG